MPNKKDLKTKILYVITKSNFGGAQKYVFDLSTNLPKDFEVTVILGGDGILKNKLNEAGIKTIVIKRLQRDVSISDDVVVFFDLLKIIKRERPSVVHLNSSKIGGIGALVCRMYNLLNYKNKTLIIFTAHGWAFNEQRSAVQRIAIKLMSWITVLLSHKTIAVSEFDYQQGILMPFIKKKISVIHNGISKINFSEKDSARETLREDFQIKIDDDTIIIGAISELHKNKGLKYTIEALTTIVEKFPKVIFVIIGEGEEREPLEEIIKKNGLEEKVFLPGYKKNASCLLKAFDIFILSSVKEGFPYVLLEAGMAKLPTISTDIGGIPEIIDDMKSGILVRSKNSVEINKAIMYLLSNKTKAKKLGHELHKKVKKELSTETMLADTMQIYKL